MHKNFISSNNITTTIIIVTIASPLSFYYHRHHRYYFVIIITIIIVIILAGIEFLHELKGACRAGSSKLKRILYKLLARLDKGINCECVYLYCISNKLAVDIVYTFCGACIAARK
jgi:hypothetical protein